MPVKFKALLLLVMVVVTTASAWITGVRMRRRIRRSLGTKVTDVELTSLATWMKVEKKRSEVGRETSLNLIWPNIVPMASA